MKTITTNKAAIFAAVVVVLALILTVEDMAYQDAVAEHEYYCERILAGDYPNFKDLDCSGVEENGRD